MPAFRPLPRWSSIAIALTVLAVSFGALLATTPNAAAITYVRGAITVDTVWGSTDNTYVITQHVTVRPGVTLTILPGTTVRFDPGRALFVEGTLIANGLPGTPIAFNNNQSIAIMFPMGIQFNTSATGSVTWSTFDRFDAAVFGRESSPTVANNTVQLGMWGFVFFRSASVVRDNAIARTGVGIFLVESGATVEGNSIDGTATGIQAITSGAPRIANNTITNTQGNLAVGIYVSAGAVADVVSNTIDTVQGTRGANGAAPGNPGGGGGNAVGILVDSAPSATVIGNTVNTVSGGRGGDGMDNAGGIGGRGGDGGSAGGIVVGVSSTVQIDGNRITNVAGGRGGPGGGSATTAAGGNGGRGGDSAGIQTLLTPTSARWYSNIIDGVVGGAGGYGGIGAVRDGDGARGGETTGLFAWAAMDGDASGNFIADVVGGNGGNSTALGGGNGLGAPGGSAVGVGYIGSPGTQVLHMNGIGSVIGGNGGRGSTGGRGGNATGAYVLGNGDRVFNTTLATGNGIQVITGGDGGLGGRIGGDGGTATGLAAALVTPSLAVNDILSLRGGNGGDAFDGTDGGRGGDAFGLTAYIVANGWSDRDVIDTVMRGLVGAGPPARQGQAFGAALFGDVNTPGMLTIENGTLAGIGDLDLSANDYGQMTTINTPFNAAKIAVAATANLTVKNYLAVDVFWPNAATFVSGATVDVEDDGTPVWSVVAPAGQVAWLLVTDRIYPGSNVAKDNRTDVTVTYLAYGFANNPRTVDMAASNTQAFVMIDTDDPTSAAGPLPAYTTTLAFAVDYTASDGSGVGLTDITLWYQRDGAGWTPFATQAAASSGSFAFTAPGDGVYEFATIAEDAAGNVEPGPGANETWTIVDTTRPGSSVQPLPTYRNTSAFTVSWSPDGGVTDIVSYTIQYNRNGAGWTTWLVNTTQTSGTFTASPASGTFQFRSLATDAAGNVELPPATNDTWTIVDTQKPFSSVVPLAPWQTTLSFLVRWEPEPPDIASYRIDVRDDAGPWTVWIPSTTALSATYTGQDGHLYEFRCTATDFAGNVEDLPAGNESWTRVDVTRPESSVLALPTYTANLTFTVRWAPDAGTTDAVSYRIEADDGAGWTVWIPSTAATSASYTGADGVGYRFRSLATDYAGNVEQASGYDAETTIDVTPPTSASALSGTSGAGGWYIGPVTVNLTSSDATSGVDEIHYRIDGGAWLVYAAPFQVTGDGSHSVQYHGHDRAANAESSLTVPFNIDTTPPSTASALVGTQGDNGWWTSSVAVSLTATDAASGVASVSYRVDSGPWQPYSGPFSVSTDGSHIVEYAATDVAGLVEGTKNASFRMDTNRPFVVTASPRGTGTNRTPPIVITFNEGMNAQAVEQAFSLTPDMNGAFSWSADGRTLTFTPARALEYATDYFVVIDSGAKDDAGNTLPQAYTFQFTTEAAPPPTIGAGFLDVWWIFAIIAAVVGGGLFIALRRMAASRGAAVAAAKERSATIDDVFLLYHDGILIKHETRRLKPDIDTDILSGMLTAVQSFVKDSFRSEEGELDELTFGEMHILIGRGKWLILAAMIQGGDGTDSMSAQLQASIRDMETNHEDQIEGWDGNMTLAKVLAPYVKKLIRGEYA